MLKEGLTTSVLYYLGACWCRNLLSSGNSRKECIDNKNPNWHEAGRIYPPYNFWIGFCQFFIKNFQTFLEVKIEINRDNLTLCQAH